MLLLTQGVGGMSLTLLPVLDNFSSFFAVSSWVIWEFLPSLIVTSYESLDWYPWGAWSFKGNKDGTDLVEKGTRDMIGRSENAVRIYERRKNKIRKDEISYW